MCARRVDTHASLSSPPARRISPPLAAAAPTPVLIVCHSEHDFLPHFFTVWLRFFCYVLRSCSTFQPCIKIVYLKSLVIKYCLCPLRTPGLPFGKRPVRVLAPDGVRHKTPTRRLASLRRVAVLRPLPPLLPHPCSSSATASTTISLISSPFGFVLFATCSALVVHCNRVLKSCN